MNKHEYLVTDDFQVKNLRVLGLDRNFDSWKFDKAVIDDKIFDYMPNSVKSFIAIKSHECFKGKKVSFVNSEVVG